MLMPITAKIQLKDIENLHLKKPQNIKIKENGPTFQIF